MPPDPLVDAWLRRHLAFSNTPRAWLERLSVLGVVVAAVALIAFAAGIPFGFQVVAWAALVVVAAVLFRRGLLKAFGPILWFDLVRTGRRTRTYLIRTAYLLILFAVIAWMYYLFTVQHSYYSSSELGQGEIARFGQRVFWTFAAFQFCLLVVLTPAYTAGAIAEERQRKTLPFILATDLRNHEIVLGKLASRLAHLGLLLLAGLPVLGAVQLLGGVDPHLLLAVFAGTGVACLSAAALGILASVVARPSRNAVFLSYAFVLSYAVLCLFAIYAPYWLFGRGWRAAPSTPAWAEEVLDGLCEVIQAGNPFIVVHRVLNSADSAEGALLQGLGAFALFHGVLAAVCTIAAGAILRKASLREAKPLQPRERRARRWFGVGDWPMVWKEVVCEGSRRRRWLVKILLAVLIAASLLPLCFAYVEYSSSRYASPEYFGERLARDFNVWARFDGTILACLALVGVGLRAAYSIRVEREKETFDTLLTTPLTNVDILWGKWLGAVLSARWALVWLAVVWGLALLFGGVHPFALPLMLFAWLAFAAGAASVGLWFSVICRSSLRAAVCTMLSGAALWFGHWLIWMVCGPLMLGFRGPSEGIQYVFMFQAGLTPPASLAILGFHSHDFRQSDFGTAVNFCGVGAVMWALIAFGFAAATAARFRRVFGRELTLVPPPYARRGPRPRPVGRLS
jgi:ABC-type transport system involved in multi-copper enzyme maturation permease subunit